METNPTQTPQSSNWPSIKAKVIEKFGPAPIAHELPDGSIVESNMERVFEDCVELDALGYENPALVLRIVQAGIAKAREL